VRGRTFVFGSSGFLFRSNKLMYDQQTLSLWNHLRGEPVVGPLTDSGIRLAVRPVVTAGWRNWRRLHPDTLVLSLDTGYQRDYTPGRPYGRYYASPDTMFPVSPRDLSRPAKDLVFVLRLPNAAKAYPLATLAREPLVHDTVAGVDVVVVSRADTRTVRAYQRDGMRFATGADPDALRDNRGQAWAANEAGLVNHASGRRLARIPGHLAYWFGWFAFHPDTPLYGR
jgi:Protein of unknown function (DUF3179)